MQMVDYAYAAAQAPSGQGGSSMMIQLAFFAAIFAIFYFLLIRPQQKQKRDRESMLSAVKPGDRVVMSSGLHGTVVKLSDQVRLDFDRSAIGRIVPAPGEGGSSS
jgi:preprotein translocase subunit YajC